MEQTKSFKLPLSLVVLDGFGALFLGLGLAKKFAGVDFLPTAFQFDKNGWLFIIIGVLLMLPMMLHFFQKYANKLRKSLLNK
jgi:hypothetical protein